MVEAPADKAKSRLLNCPCLSMQLWDSFLGQVPSHSSTPNPYGCRALSFCLLFSYTVLDSNMEYLRILQDSHCPLAALQRVAWLSFMKSSKDLAHSTNYSLGVRHSCSGEEIVSRPLALHASESTVRQPTLPNNATRQFWFLSSGREVIVRKRVRGEGGTCLDSEDSGDGTRDAQRRRKCVRFFVSETHLALPNGSIEEDASTACASSSSSLRLGRMPQPILLPKISDKTASWFTYEATKRLRLFVISNASLFAPSPALVAGARDAILKTVNEAARIVSEALTRAAGSLVAGHVVALSRVLDGNALIPKGFLFAEVDELAMPTGGPQDGERLQRHLGRIHQSPLVVGAEDWCSPAEIKGAIVAFLHNQDPAVLVSMLLVPMAPLQQK